MIRGGIRHASATCVIDLFGNLQTLHQALDYHLERHNVLASNVAHVDTPGYRPSDLARVEGGQFAAVFNVEMQRTTEGHLKGASEGSQAQVGRIFEDASAGFGNDGNAVSMDREAAKLAANHLRYDVVSTIVASQIKGLMYAANDGRG
jgi:flagellar basal-body rod protein FlgB